MIEGPIKVGNINLTAFTTGHTEEHWEKNKDALTTEIMDHSLVIVEYNYKEQKRISGWPYRLLNSHIDFLNSTDNYLLIQVVNLCEELKKDVCVFDPAYNESFILFHGVLFSISIFPPLATVVAMGRQLYEQRHKLVTKRAFITGGIAAVSTVTAAMLGIGAVVGPNRIPGPSPALGDIENDFRECIVAQLTIDLGASLSKPTDALMIYTPEHWNGIRANLASEDQRRQTLERYLWLGNFDVFKPLFQARHYPEGKVSVKKHPEPA